ncbi:MAG TPA: EpsI family protein [Pyrinomonadaceae bacterium]|jgi:EpsI family protein|nr:EpsI family protein [Pyrinomonadaceae bacterium]
MSDSKSNRWWRSALLLAVLLIGGIVINTWALAGEAHVERRPLKDFPTQVETWQRVGADQVLDQQTADVLRADDFLSRLYRRPDGNLASFYVGYFATQRTGATYHSPLNCLPGSGWTMNEPATIRITPADGSSPFEANRYIIQNGDDRQMLVYWYQGRGRIVASEYWGKLYTVLDSVRRRRSDGAIVRVMVPIGKSERAALDAATSFAAEVAPVLPGYVPN